MLPRRPPRSGQLGFLYLPPYRIQGISIAGEQTAVHIPELDVAFDVGLCPRPVLSAPCVAISHGHMDHVAGLPYYFSQRVFQKMGSGTCVCHESIAGAIQTMMGGWVDLEQQHTPFTVVPLKHEGEYVLKPNIVLKGIESDHTVPSMSFVVVEHRKKLLEKYQGLPQEQLRDLKIGGTEITQTLRVPLVAYTGDTCIGDHLYREEFTNAKTVITECTFFEEEHKKRSVVGKHLHVEDLKELLSVWGAENIVIVHTSRRTTMEKVVDFIKASLGSEDASRVHLLMDHRTNRLRYEKQRIDSEDVGEGA